MASISRHNRAGFLCAILIFAAGCASRTVPVAATPTPAATPAAQWRWPESTPEAQGMDSAQLAAMVEHIHASGLPIRAIVVVRHGAVVAESYFYPYRARIPHNLHSVAKSIIGLLAGIAVDRGAIDNVHLPLARFYPEYATLFQTLPGKNGLMLDHLLTMRCGLKWDEIHSPYGSAGNSVYQMAHADDKVAFFMNLPVVELPGSRFAYNSGASLVLAETLTRATSTSLPVFANRYLFAPLSISQYRWDPSASGALFMTAREAAKIGQLMIHRGRWQGHRVVSEQWIGDTFRSRRIGAGKMGYGYQGWILPSGAYMAAGFGGQRIFVDPRRDLVVVVLAALTADQPPPRRLLDRFVLPAIRSQQPLPENPLALQRLQSACRSAAQTEQRVAALPADAIAKLADRWLQLEPNDYGLRRARLNLQKRSGEATVELEGAGPRRRLAVGLDGRPRISYLSAPGWYHGHYALKGKWQLPDALQISLTAVDRAARYEVRVRWMAGRVIIEFKELVEGVHHSLAGRFAGPGDLRQL